MRIGVDTAILIRGHGLASGPARELLTLIGESGYRLVLSPYVLAEVERVLRYPRLQALFGLTESAIAAYIKLLESIADVVEPAEGPPIVLDDPQDDPIIYTAVAGQADILCTVDKHFYAPNVLAFCTRRGIRVMSDVQLLRFLRQVI